MSQFLANDLHKLIHLVKDCLSIVHSGVHNHLSNLATIENYNTAFKGKDLIHYYLICAETLNSHVL